MRVVDGTLEDVIGQLPLITRSIREKADLTPADVRARLEGRRHGVAVALDDGRVAGLYVWYEEEGALYLWLGACERPGNGTGAQLQAHLERTTDYRVWRVKTSVRNEGGRRYLERYGFARVEEAEGVLTYERRR